MTDQRMELYAIRDTETGKLKSEGYPDEILAWDDRDWAEYDLECNHEPGTAEIVVFREEPTEPCERCAVKHQECIPGDAPYSFEFIDPNFCASCGRSLG